MSDYTPQLRSLMQSLGFTSFRALSRAAGVSKWQVEQLRKGRVAQMRLEVLLKLSQALQITLDELLAIYSNLLTTPSNPTASSEEVQQLRQEYQRLQTQLEQQQIQLQQDFQRSCLQILESWMIQFPTAAYAAQQNPQVPADRLLPLMRPVEQLLKTWSVEPLAAVGTELPYDPQYHQLMEGSANPGDLVKIRYTGYCQGDKLLHRAKVSPVQASTSEVRG